MMRSGITTLVTKPSLAMLALCVAVQAIEYEFQWVDGESVVPVPDGVVWLYHYGWGPVLRHKLADNIGGKLQFYFSGLIYGPVEVVSVLLIDTEEGGTIDLYSGAVLLGTINLPLLADGQSQVVPVNYPFTSQEVIDWTFDAWDSGNRGEINTLKDAFHASNNLGCFD